ncbi:hypothetical protein B0H10DRAFT_2046200 [Mycena sp. CBHHK59/15]|nr:hypothetical protein B0H10DRAFT_2046200 [Mycena sp. CBHHK59/15]
MIVVGAIMRDGASPADSRADAAPGDVVLGAEWNACVARVYALARPPGGRGGDLLGVKYGSSRGGRRLPRLALGRAGHRLPHVKDGGGRAPRTAMCKDSRCGAVAERTLVSGSGAALLSVLASRRAPHPDSQHHGKQPVMCSTRERWDSVAASSAEATHGHSVRMSPHARTALSSPHSKFALYPSTKPVFHTSSGVQAASVMDGPISSVFVRPCKSMPLAVSCEEVGEFAEGR